jgi:hypothetical protein
MINPWMWVGLLLGLRHALEPDHLAAVAALSARSPSFQRSSAIATLWGLGHLSVMSLVALLAPALRQHLPASLVPVLPIPAAVLMLFFGLAGFLRTEELPSQELGIDHGLWAALLIGSAHGLAGSAVLMLATLPVLVAHGGVVAFLSLFGIGSIVGMVCLSSAVTAPMRLFRPSRTRIAAVRVAVSASSLLAGVWTLTRL